MFDSDIGKHCENTNCSRQDYLPRKCEKYCKSHFCTMCFVEHKCEMYMEQEDIKLMNIDIARKEKEMEDKIKAAEIKRKKKKCIITDCKNNASEPFGIKCTGCGNVVCISHRYDHFENCKRERLRNRYG